jgi:hypothetical protein
VLEQQLRESGGAAAHASSLGTAAGSGVGGDVPVPEAIAEDELVVIRHRLQGELNSIDGRYVHPALQPLLHASDHSELFPALFSLVEKERLLGELMRSQKEFESMKHSFESKLQVRSIATRWV